jgi:meso-butanediol dehydrogenase / (S,S)-butanediol dehydrogenase / diacetyl reductase
LGRLDGLTVLVVDASARFGRAACLSFAAEGARVMAADPVAETARGLAQEIGHHAGWVRLDPVDPTSCEQAVETTRSEFGTLDVLCNRAPSPPPPANRKRLHELSRAEWQAGIDEGLTSVALPTRFALRCMVGQSSGAILVIGSGAGLVGVPYLSAFSASSAGLLNFTRNLALDAQRSGHAIRANMVCLGSAWDALLPERDEAPPAASEIAPLLVFLASAESRHVNGAIVPIDDGLTAWR